MFRRCLFTGILLYTPVLIAQNNANLTARELFYAPPAKVAPAAAKPAEKIARRTPPRKAEPKPVEVAVHNNSGAGRAPAPLPDTSSYSDPKFVKASFGADEAVPLGLRYSLLRRNSGNGYDEVDAGTVFHSGDKIRVRVEANDNVYLYIVMRGSSGSWRVLFPSAEIEGGDNRVRRGRAYDLPPGGRFTFDETQGEEKLFLVLSRQPEESLETLIYSLSAKPVSTQPEQQPRKQPKRMLMASNLGSISDDLVANLRGKVYARDLVFEKVDDQTAAAPGEKKETAVYVVNPSRDPDARLVVDLKLQHQ
ncbi:MAG: DUF4384 domain-containing protein [Acidobacteria bacterium]|nr:DUF4384 domain-containing protein [Acidobacteriota bacterium]